MGYEVARFIYEVDEEFICTICKMVLKDPTQSPCEHLFCNECINGWLAVDQSCPVERGPLQMRDLKPALRIVRNLMNKFEIKCDFESKGCAAIVKLENLQVHLGRCEYNPNENENEIITKEKEILKLSNETSNATNDLINEQPEFRVWYYMKISIDQPYVLEVDNGIGSAQSVYSLNHTKFSFKIEILSLESYIGIGLVPLCTSFRTPSFGEGTISYKSNGFISIDGKYTNISGEWKVGDIVECGIKFPSDFVNDGRRVQVYFNKNGESIHDGLVAMPINGLFPTVCINEASKIKYLTD